MDRGAWWAAVHGVAKSQTWLSDFIFSFHLHALEKEMATHSSVLAWRIPGTGWAAVYGVTQNWTWLKRLSSSSLPFWPQVLTERERAPRSLYFKKIPRHKIKSIEGIPWWLSSEEYVCQCRRHGFDPWSDKIPPGYGATKSVYQNYWACALKPGICNYWRPLPRACTPRQEKPQQWEAHTSQRRVALSLQLRESPCAETKIQHSSKQ